MINHLLIEPNAHGDGVCSGVSSELDCSYELQDQPGPILLWSLIMK